MAFVKEKMEGLFLNIQRIYISCFFIFFYRNLYHVKAILFKYEYFYHAENLRFFIKQLNKININKTKEKNGNQKWIYFQFPNLTKFVQMQARRQETISFFAWAVTLKIQFRYCPPILW